MLFPLFPLDLARDYLRLGGSVRAFAWYSNGREVLGTQDDKSERCVSMLASVPQPDFTLSTPPAQLLFLGFLSDHPGNHWLS